MLKATLDNGLEVILVEDHSAPVVALNVWVRVGSADERTEQWGMAHVHEHMLFKGTTQRGVGEIASTVEGAGGNINAFTSYDMTVYHITMASRDAAVGFDVLADAMQNSTFDATELAKEEEVVIEEIRRSDDAPDNLLSRVLFETAYQTHPYSKEVIGTQESVRSFSREGLLDFYHSWYVPNNMTFVAVGDFDPKVALEQIQKAFANAKP
ncbi:MAG: M16 family metallopeptidase, partial [Myxococcota bacterium]